MGTDKLLANIVIAITAAILLCVFGVVLLPAPLYEYRVALVAMVLVLVVLAVIVILIALMMWFLNWYAQGRRY